MGSLSGLQGLRLWQSLFPTNPAQWGSVVLSIWVLAPNGPSVTVFVLSLTSYVTLGLLEPVSSFVKE